MMDTNASNNQNTNAAFSILNLETIFNLNETGFEEWKFYDDPQYESAFNYPVKKTDERSDEHLAKEHPLKRGWAA